MTHKQKLTNQLNTIAFDAFQGFYMVKNNTPYIFKKETFPYC